MRVRRLADARAIIVRSQTLRRVASRSDSTAATWLRTRATSTGSLTFTCQNALNLGGGVSSTDPIQGHLETFYCGTNGIYAAPTDGTTWGQGQLVLPSTGKVICDPSVIQLPDGSYKMYYKVVNSPS